MKKNILTLMLIAITAMAFSQDYGLVKTAESVIYKVNPIDSAEVVQIIESVEFDYRDSLMRITIINAYVSDSNYIFINRMQSSRTMAELLETPSLALIINGVKSTAVSSAVIENNAYQRYNHTNWSADSIRFELIR